MSLQVGNQISVLIFNEEQPDVAQLPRKKTSLCEKITSCFKAMVCCACCTSKKMEEQIDKIQKEKALEQKAFQGQPSAPKLQPLVSNNNAIPDITLDDIDFELNPSYVQESSSSLPPRVQVKVVTTITITSVDEKNNKQEESMPQLLAMIAALGQKGEKK